MAAAPGGKFKWGFREKHDVRTRGLIKSAKRFMKSVSRHVLVLSVLRALF